MMIPDLSLEYAGCIHLNPNDLPVKTIQLFCFSNDQLSQQVERGTYDLDACLTLLRLYSFSPEHVNVNVISKILIKAMLQLPSPDFALMLNMIPERLQASDWVMLDCLVEKLDRFSLLSKFCSQP